jgi:HEPN domain-containing protein
MTRRRFTTKDGFVPDNLVVAARDHLMAARCLLRSCGPFGLDSAGYLCHLAAELILKAWLLHRDGEFPRSHLVVELADKLQAETPVLAAPETRKKLEVLDRFNELRYPIPTGGVAVSEPDATDLIAFISNVLFDALPATLQNLPVPYRQDEQGRFMKDNRYIMVKPKTE